MNAGLMLLSAALGVGVLAGCDRTKEPANEPKVEVPLPQRADSLPLPSTVPTPSVVNQVPPQSPPTAAERKEGTTPIQGHMDPREPAQRKAFENTKG